MDWDIVLGCLFIFVARLGDVSLDTLRVVMVIRGNRFWAWALGFVQVLIWVLALSTVFKNLDKPLYAVSYAFGFACGNFLGITIENWLAHGEQVIRVFTRQGDSLAARLRGHGYRVTVFDGRGRDGPVWLLYIEATRRQIKDVARLARSMDPTCFYVIEDVRAVSTPVAVNSTTPISP
ncbi:MAG: DUF2179 domain-containing protein [Phycisphaeraceae bacterium]|nr:DUF2179 domain-containing protein [Phycisphaeraceae bacterium]